MDAMLMGGIVPSQITPALVRAALAKEFKRVRKITYAGVTSEGKNWLEIIAGFGKTTADVEKLVTAVTDFLRISAQYGLIGGPNALARLRTARINLILLERPLVDIAIRVMKDMRKATGNRMKDLRKQFYDEEDPATALRLMQFAPGFSFYKNQLLALPDSLQKRLANYQKPAKMGAAIRRARKRLESYPLYTELEDFDALAYNSAYDTIRRERGDFAPFRRKLTQQELDRVAQAQRTMAAHDEAYYNSLLPVVRGRY